MSGGVTLLIVDIVKKITRVPRPVDALVQLSDYAFPSGHSAFAFTMATVVFLFLINSKISKPSKVVLSIGLFLVAGHTAYQRLLLQVHTLNQVIVGAILGIVVAMVVSKLFDLFIKKLRQ